MLAYLILRHESFKASASNGYVEILPARKKYGKNVRKPFTPKFERTCLIQEDSECGIVHSKAQQYLACEPQSLARKNIASNTACFSKLT